jgi:hypothetical protein
MLKISTPGLPKYIKVGIFGTKKHLATLDENNHLLLTVDAGLDER